MVCADDPISQSPSYFIAFRVEFIYQTDYPGHLSKLDYTIFVSSFYFPW